MPLSRLLTASAVLLAAATPVRAVPAPEPKSQAIDLVVCIDTSTSMDGLIDSAKNKLWAVVNDLAKIKPTPNLRVALYSYGSNVYDPKTGWVRKNLDLTTDLDAVYKQLFGLKTHTGDEFVARVTKTAVTDLKWSDDKQALKVIFVCGNEPADQDKEVTLKDAAETATKAGVVINTIYCGPGTHPETGLWKDYAAMCGGKYTNIDQDRGRTEVAVKTEFDEQIVKLNAELNGTYVAYGKDGGERQSNQAKQDDNAAKTASAALAERAATKAGALYRNSSWDLIDRMKEDKDFDIKKLKAEDLCDELKKLKPEEREEYLRKKAEGREKLKKEIAVLADKRAKVIEEESKKKPAKSAADKAFDEAVRAMLRTQAEAKGMKFGE